MDSVPSHSFRKVDDNESMHDDLPEMAGSSMSGYFDQYENILPTFVARHKLFKTETLTTAVSNHDALNGDNKIFSTIQSCSAKEGTWYKTSLMYLFRNSFKEITFNNC